MTGTIGKLSMGIVLCGIAFVVGSCGDGRTLTGPTAGTPTAAPAAIPSNAAPIAANTGGVTQLRFSVNPLTVPAYPACPLTPPSAGVITGTGVLTIVLRTIADANGGTHVGTTIYGNGTATDQTGARWVWSDADHNNELFPSGNTSSNSFSQTITEGFHVIGPKGEQIKVKGTFHITVANGKTVVEFEKGNHEANEFCESGFTLTPLP